MHRRAVAVAAAGVVAAVLAGCSGSSAPAAADGTSGQAAGIQVDDPAPVTEAGARTRVVVQVDGQGVPLTVVLPDDYAAGRTAPLLLALPPGGQGQSEVDALLDKYWAADAQRRGWVVVSPEAPGSGLFISGESADLLPDLVDAVERWYPPEGGRLHVAGVSNGGLSAWRYALDHPGKVRSLLAAPGYPPESGDEADVAKLADVPVLLVVGGDDTGWRDAMTTTRDDLRAAGGQVRLIVSPGEGHIFEHVTAATLWKFLQSSR